MNAKDVLSDVIVKYPNVQTLQKDELFVQCLDEEINEYLTKNDSGFVVFKINDNGDFIFDSIKKTKEEIDQTTIYAKISKQKSVKECTDSELNIIAQDSAKQIIEKFIEKKRREIAEYQKKIDEAVLAIQRVELDESKKVLVNKLLSESGVK